MYSHDHEISHLNEFDRRKFLKVSAAFSGLAILNQLSSPTAEAAATVRLAGFSAFSKSVKVLRSGSYY
jgi:hypothetical protein